MTRQLKIAIITGEIPAPTFVERLISGLACSGTKILVMGKRRQPVAARENVKLIGVQKKIEPISRRLLFLQYFLLLRLFKPGAYRSLMRVKHRPNHEDYALVWHRPHIVHLQWVKAVAHYQWVQNFGIKLVVSLRGAHINYSPLADPDLAAIYRQIFPVVDGFHGVSSAICREAEQYGADIKRCRVVYSGFDLSQFPFSNPKKHRSKEALKVVSVGRAHWKKGYHYALSAMYLLREKGVRFQYQIIGVGQAEELTFQLNQLDLAGCVLFEPKQPLHQVLKTIAEADVFLLPSVEEGIANVVIEAMLVGTPVITTNCGGMEETVAHGESGWVVPVRQPQAIADAILEFSRSSPEKRAEIRQTARKKVEQQHSEQQMVNNMKALYQEVLK